MRYRLFIASILFSSLLSAQTPPSELKKIIANCASCHGEQGISPINAIPNLAGQHAEYTLKQLQDYQNKTLRDNAVMHHALKAVSPKDYARLAEYYSRMPKAHGQTPQAFLRLGETLYRGGDPKRHITACIACHGPKGLGNGPAKFPVLSGQKPEYTQQQLKMFKSHQRKNDLNGIMRDIAGRLEEKDIKALAYYCSGLH
jgi:cytochrome c553